MSDDAAQTVALRLTLAHHGDNEFYDLGIIEHEATPQRLWDFLAADPATECCRAEETGHDQCWLVDQMHATAGPDHGEYDLGDTREVTREQAESLLGSSLDDAVAASRARLAGVYEWLARRDVS